MRYVDPKELVEFSNLLNSASKETLGLLQASLILNRKFPKGTALSSEEMIRAANFLTSQSRGILSFDDSMNVVRTLYNHKVVSVN